MTLTADEERDLAERSALGDIAARHRLILAYLRLSVEIARRFTRRGVPLDDLIQEANLGLIRASSDFDPDVHGCRFATYAEVWARAFIHRALARDASWPNPAPIHFVLMANRHEEDMDVFMDASPAALREARKRRRRRQFAEAAAFQRLDEEIPSPCDATVVSDPPSAGRPSSPVSPRPPS